MSSLRIRAWCFASGSNNLSLHTADHTDQWNRANLLPLLVYCISLTESLIPDACLFIVCQTLNLYPIPHKHFYNHLHVCSLMEFNFREKKKIAFHFRVIYSEWRVKIVWETGLETVIILLFCYTEIMHCNFKMHMKYTMSGGQGPLGALSKLPRGSQDDFKWFKGVIGCINVCWKCVYTSTL